MASHPTVRTASELHRRLCVLGFEISYRQVVRLVQEKPTNLNLDLLAGIMNVLDCTLDDLLLMQEHAENEHLQRVAAVSRMWDGLSAQEKAILRQLAASD